MRNTVTVVCLAASLIAGTPVAVAVADGITGALVAEAQEGNVEILADRFAPQALMCPGDPVYMNPVCEGKPDGTVVEAFIVGRYNSEGGAVGRGTLEAFLTEVLGGFSNHDFALYTISNSGFGDCPSCRVITLSTPADADTADGSAVVMSFQVNPEGLVHSLVAGLVSGDELAIVQGGQ